MLGFFNNVIFILYKYIYILYEYILYEISELAFAKQKAANYDFAAFHICLSFQFWNFKFT